MKKYKTTKYMNLFTSLGCLIGFAMIILYTMTKSNYFLPLAGVIIIFAGRLLGYAIDRTIEYRDEYKK